MGHGRPARREAPPFFFLCGLLAGGEAGTNSLFGTRRKVGAKKAQTITRCAERRYDEHCDDGVTIRAHDERESPPFLICIKIKEGIATLN